MRASRIGRKFVPQSTIDRRVQAKDDRLAEALAAFVRRTTGVRTAPEPVVEVALVRRPDLQPGPVVEVGLEPIKNIGNPDNSYFPPIDGAA